MAQPVPVAERKRRQNFMNLLFDQGYSPLGQKGILPSAAQEGKRRDRVNYSRWIRDEEKIRLSGKVHYLPKWVPELQKDVTGQVLEFTSSDHAETRARRLRSEVEHLLTMSKYPVVNPESIIISSHLTQRYNRKIGEHTLVEATPRTWMSDTLRVSPIADSRNRKFLFTGAQNDAPIHEGFWDNLKAYAEYLGAEIVVGPYTYETQWWSESNPIARSYASDLSEHLCFGQMAIGDNFVFCGEMNTLPTASQPISDLTTYPRNKWAVFPHAKRQLKSVPSTDPEIQAHQVMTTGAVTRPKVIPRKAGVKSLFHTVLGAVITEFDETGSPFCRQITATPDGSFYDLDIHVRNKKVTTGHRVTALVCGDIHLRKMDPANSAAVFGFTDVNSSTTYRNNMLSVLNPFNVVLHDIFDNETRNHHNAGDHAGWMVLHEQGRDSVLDEIIQVTDFLKKVDNSSRKVVVVESNHDIGLDRYIREGRYRFDATNLKLGLVLDLAYVNYRSRAAVASTKKVSGRPEKFSILEYAVRNSGLNSSDVVWAYDGDSYLIDGIECGHHGFRGANGSKGTIHGFARTGRKMTIGDKHTAEIDEGVFCAGCMTLQQQYNKGPSSWSISHVIQYADGHRSIVTLQNGRWRAEKPRIGVKSA